MFDCTEAHQIVEVTEERDLGLLFTKELKFDKHISLVIKKANSILCIIKHNFCLLDPQMFRIIYTILVRPHLDFSCVVWSPYLDIKAIEAVQRRALSYL